MTLSSQSFSSTAFGSGFEILGVTVIPTEPIPYNFTRKVTLWDYVPVHCVKMTDKLPVNVKLSEFAIYVEGFMYD